MYKNYKNFKYSKFFYCTKNKAENKSAILIKK